MQYNTLQDMSKQNLANPFTLSDKRVTEEKPK